MLFGDNMYIGNSPVDAVYLGNTQVWSAIPADVKAHIARVTADGGTVPEQAKMVSMVKKLIAANLWNNCVFFGLCLGGVKKDGNEYVSKVYDLKANADLLQSTATRQPKYNTDGSLLYDGGDNMFSGAFAIDNPIRNCLTNITVICWVKLGATNIQQELICRSANTQATRSFEIWSNNANSLTFQLFHSSLAMKTFTTNGVDFSANMVCVGLTYNGSVMDGAIQGLSKIYINGVEHNPIKTVNQNVPILNNVDTRIEFGSAFNGIARKLSANSVTSLLQIYNSTCTPEQILWNYNNIRPEGV